jgi:hypothetical protein
LHHRPHLPRTSPVVEIATWNQPVVWFRTHRLGRKVCILWLCLVMCEAPRLLMRSHGSTCCGRNNLNYTSSSALILSRKAARTQPHFKQCNPMVC